MRDNLAIGWLVRLFALLCVALLPQFAYAADTGGAQEQAQRQATQPGNNAPVWRDVRGGDHPYQTTQVRGVETNVLVQSGGEIWRQIRNGPLTIYGGWLLVVVTVLIGFYYWRMGPLKLHEKPSGRLIERFNAWERTVHWATAISFLILAASGTIILFGKYILLPVFGYALFSWLAILSKNLHNFAGPLFSVCVVLMFVTFVKDNLPKAYDWIWVRKLGGFLGSREHVPSGRFNAGEKAWFWLGVTLLAIISAVSGFILDFPNFAQGRGMMQQANVIHAISAVLFVALALGHIYVGTIGVERAYETMRTGMADETWAKEHHEYWYNEVVANRGRAPGGAPNTAAASSMKEGWRI
jgi:formate dehydrogenase subunit gamma